jgi:uncharacterized damage-inducible protein DinB
VRKWHLDPAEGFEPGVGRFVAMFAEARTRLVRDLDDLSARELDVSPSWAVNSIGTLLYHVAAIELDWTFADLRQVDKDGFPPEAVEWFPVDVRERDGRLAPVVEPLDRHLERMEWVRGHLFETLASMTDADLDRSFGEGDDASGGAWILHHLLQHEAEHRGQIGELKAALRA